MGKEGRALSLLCCWMEYGSKQNKGERKKQDIPRASRVCGNPRQVFFSGPCLYKKFESSKVSESAPLRWPELIGSHERNIALAIVSYLLTLLELQPGHRPWDDPIGMSPGAPWGIWSTQPMRGSGREGWRAQRRGETGTVDKRVLVRTQGTRKKQLCWLS